MIHKLIKTDNYLLVVDESEIKEGDFRCNIQRGYISLVEIDEDTAYYNRRNDVFKRVIAHLPLNGSPILEGVPLLPPYSRHQEDGVEQMANTMFRNKIDSLEEIHSDYILGVTEGYNKAREKYKYTEEDMRKAFIAGESRWGTNGEIDTEPTQDEFIQSLHQCPTEFECEMVWTNSYGSEVSVNSYDVQSLKPKTITAAQGVQWVGKYK